MHLKYKCREEYWSIWKIEDDGLHLIEDKVDNDYESWCEFVPWDSVCEWEYTDIEPEDEQWDILTDDETFVECI